MNNPCEVCTKTNNHCCTASTPWNQFEVVYYIGLAIELGINVIAKDHPKNEGMVVLGNADWKGEVDLDRTPCIFLKDGKCSIYEERPFICKHYGTKFIPCRYTASGIHSEEEIASQTIEDIRHLDQFANDNSGINELFKMIKKKGIYK